MGTIDPAGTTPGLKSEGGAEQKTINMKCRGPKGCDSIQAVEVTLGQPAHHGQRLYRCVKCGHPMGVSLGGHIDI